MRNTFLVILLCSLAGCFPYPAQVAMPIKTEVIDAESGAPVEGLKFYVLRVTFIAVIAITRYWILENPVKMGK